MLTLDVNDFSVQFKEGTVNNVGGPTKSATVKLFEPESVAARAFGDRRVKMAFDDAEGNEVEVALSPGDIERLEADLRDVRQSNAVEGFGTDDS